MKKNKNEWVIHVWGKERDKLELTDVEQFHINMLKMYQDQQKRFDKILINIALYDIKDKKLFNFLKKEISKSIVNNNVEFKYCQNDYHMGEYVTFRPYVFDRIGEDVNIFYSHFKGYRSYLKINRESYPERVSDFCEMFWSYIMYKYLLNIDDVQEKFNNGKSVYCWLVLGTKIENLDKIQDDYYISYQSLLHKDNEELRNCIEGDLSKHSPGSFMWYSMKNIGTSLKNKKPVTGITTDYLINHSTDVRKLCTHFCELYLMQFLKDEECYSVCDFDDVWNKMKNSLYLNLYPSKKIARELIGDFEKYLIENKLI